MQSPFPGVDPFLEDQYYWADFHTRFITYCCDALADRLPDHYEARIDEWVSLVDDTEEPLRSLKPDIGIERQRSGAAPGRSSAIATLKPVTIPLVMSEPHRQGYVKILRRPERSLVTVLEVLSPTNKFGEGRGEYINKRNALPNQPIHLVELDLLRRGRRLPMRAPLPRGEFFAMVSRSENRPDCDVYAWGIRDSLPTIPVPLRSPDPDIALNLAEVFNISYERGRYRKSIDYKRTLELPLDPADGTLAETRLSENR